MEVGGRRSRVSARHKGEGRIVGSWVMGKEKSDTPLKRVGTAFIQLMGAKMGAQDT